MNNELIIEHTNELNEVEAAQVLDINAQNLVSNGGQLYCAGILEHKFAVLAKINEKIVGYALLLPDFLFENDLYVMQVAVDRNYHHHGIGSKLYKYSYEYSKGFCALTANANETNTVSNKFHKKMGFKKAGVNELGNIYVKPVTKKVTKTFDEAEPMHFKINKELCAEREQ